MTGPSIEEKRRALLELRLRQRRAEQAGRERVAPVARSGPLPLTWQQEGLWFLRELDPGSVTYHVPVAYRLSGDLDVAALQEALCTVVARHESLRTRFGTRGATPIQTIDPPRRVRLETVDLTAVPGPLRYDTSLRLAHEQIRRPFDLAAGPPLRCWLARLAADDHILLLTMHHLVTDGWSLGILARELGEAYRAARAGEAPDLPELPIQPADFAVWQRGPAAADSLGRGVEHWRTRLAGLPVLDFPADRPRAGAGSADGDARDDDREGASVSALLPAGLGARLSALAAERGGSLLPALTAAFFTVLGRYTGQEDLAVGSVFSGRTRSEIEPLIGFFANTLVLRGDLSGRPTFRELVARCDGLAADALAHQDVPFGLVVDALRPPRAAGRNPLFQVCLNLLPARIVGADLTSLGGLALEEVPLPATGSRFDLSLQVEPRADGQLGVAVEYSARMFDRARVERLVGHFGQVLVRAAADPDAPVARIEITAPDERVHLLERLSAPDPRPQSQAPDVCVPDLVARQARRAPDRVAVSCEGEELTYGELESRANRLARFLRHAGVGADAVVGVCAYRSPELVVALLGVLKSGGAYLPLDPELPALRLSAQLADARVSLVVAEARTADLAAQAAAMAESQAGRAPRIVRIDEDWPLISQASDEPAQHRSAPGDLAYVIFTSGSTGVPKGVAVSHGGLANRLVWMQDAFRLGPDDVVAQKTPFSFDVSVWEFFWPLMSGARLALAAPGGHRDFGYLARMLTRERVTVTHFVPSVLAAFRADPSVDPARLDRLRLLICSGEALSAPVRDAALAAWPRAALYNLYGPTEASIDVTFHPCSSTDGPVVPIGRPVANTRIYVIDSWGDPAPVGVPGELCIAGIQIARGYLGRAGLTAERFVPCPFGAPGERMYRTGDVVRWRDDATLEYLGRNDDQVKIRGLRVEPGEIERVLAAHPALRHAAVAVRSAGGEPNLAAYVVPQAGGDAAEAELRAYLADRLPLHMVPATFTRLDTLPLTGSGKLDRKALPDPVIPGAGAPVSPVGRTQQEIARIWSHLLSVPLDRIGQQENFFTLGGNSLDLSRFAAEARARFGLSLEPRAVYLAPTVEAVAALLDERRSAAPGPDAADPDLDTPLVPLRATGTRPPLFLVHAVGGSVAPYLPLTALLDPRQPVYAFQAPGIDAGEPLRRLEDLAQRYVEALRSVQRTGPYRLGGWSVGGTIALEMARRLRAAGQEIALLALFDSVVPQQLTAPADETALLLSFAEDVALIRGAAPPPIDAAVLRRLTGPEQVEQVITALEESGLAPAAVREEMRRRIAVFAATLRACVRYRPGPLDRPVTLIEAADSPPGKAAQWEPYAPAGLEHHVVAGSHHSMLKPPFLGALAEILRACLDR